MHEGRILILMSLPGDDCEQGLQEDFLYEKYATQKPQDRLFLYEAESQILTLYDQLVQSRLEKALLKAAIETPSGM